MVCKCMNVDLETLERAIEAGAVDGSDLAAMTGAGRYCGGCFKTLEALAERARARRHQRLKDAA